MGHIITNQWKSSEVKKKTRLEQLVYRSQILGRDKRITNYGGGNTSSKITGRHPVTGKTEQVLWVKGSGGDLGSIKANGFASFSLNGFHQLEAAYRGLQHEDEMVERARYATWKLNPRVGSIDTPLHAFLPYQEIDHLHPDSIIAIACSKNGKAIMQKIYGSSMAWVPWQRPGFDLGLNVRSAVEKIGFEQARGLILGGHGLVTWGETPLACYTNTIEVINMATQWLEKNIHKPIFGGTESRLAKPLPQKKRLDFVAEIFPLIRGAVSKHRVKTGHFSDSDAVMEFLQSKNLSKLAKIGTSCPDHFLRTKRTPLLLSLALPKILSNPMEESAFKKVAEVLSKELEKYGKAYKQYYASNRDDKSPAMRDEFPVIILIPGIGMLAFAANKATARIATEFYTNAINVMRGAEGVNTYVGLSEKEAFRIEYWKLEEDKLKRLPPPLPLSGKVALITGGAGGIGRAICERFLRDGANVILADLDVKALLKVCAELGDEYGHDRVLSSVMNVRNEKAVQEGIKEAVLTYGGIDILVANAGMASASKLEETSLEEWERNMGVLATGYFLVAREGFKVMKRQGSGGSIIFVASKNALVASAGASAYCTAKAAEVHLARCLALEGAPYGIRANVVNPDAVLRGSKIWSGQWRAERAKGYGVRMDQLEDFYRKRSLLKRAVYPEDIAEAVYFFASDRSAKSTGNILNVDAGNVASFTR